MTTNFLCQINLLLASAEPADPPIQVRLDTMIFSLLIFIGLMIILVKYGWKPIMEGLDNREKSIADDIDSAKQAHEKAQAVLAQYEQKIAAAGDEAAQVISEAKDEAKRAKERIMAEASEAAAKQREKAVAEINAAKDQAVRELAERSVDSAVSLAQGMLGKELDRSAHSKLIEESINRFSQTNQFSNN